MCNCLYEEHFLKNNYHRQLKYYNSYLTLLNLNF